MVICTPLNPGNCSTLPHANNQTCLQKSQSPKLVLKTNLESTSVLHLNITLPNMSCKVKPPNWFSEPIWNPPQFVAAATTNYSLRPGVKSYRHSIGSHRICLCAAHQNQELHVTCIPAIAKPCSQTKAMLYPGHCRSWSIQPSRTFPSASTTMFPSESSIGYHPSFTNSAINASQLPVGAFSTTPAQSIKL